MLLKEMIMLLKIANMPKVRLCKILTADKIRRKSEYLDLFPKSLQEFAYVPSPKLSSNLLETMWKMVRACLTDDGIGLAAPQIGVFKRLFVIREDEDHFRAYIHPSYYAAPNSTQETQFEGCLSVPGKRLPISRWSEIVAEWQEFSPDGSLVICTDLLEGVKARVFQHECDHLSGLSILDRHKQQQQRR